MEDDSDTDPLATAPATSSKPVVNLRELGKEQSIEYFNHRAAQGSTSVAPKMKMKKYLCSRGLSTNEFSSVVSGAMQAGWLVRVPSTSCQQKLKLNPTFSFTF